MGIVIVIHFIVCIGLIGIILIQRGRGGGFVENFSGLESMFGTKTSSMLSRLTSIFAVAFFFTCLVLTFFSLKQSRSLIHDFKIDQPSEQTNATGLTSQEQPLTQEVTSTPVTAEQIPVPVEQNVTTQQIPRPMQGELK